MTMLDRLRELEAKATKGPWVWTPARSVDHDDSLTAATGPLIHNGAFAETGYSMRSEDGELIVAARNALPLLLRVAEAADAWERAVDASDAELERTEKALDAAVRAMRSEQ